MGKHAAGRAGRLASKPGRARGGDDTLVGGASAADTLWGDAAIVAPEAHTGADLFVIGASRGHDVIMDFEPGRDHLLLTGFGYASPEELIPVITGRARGWPSHSVRTTRSF